MPQPLVAGDLDGQVGPCGVFHLDQHLRRRHRHRHQNQERHDRPCDFGGGAVVELLRLVAARFAVAHQRNQHGAEHDDADGDANPENQHVQAEHLAADVGYADGHVVRLKLGQRGQRQRRRGARKPSRRRHELRCHLSEGPLCSSNRRWRAQAPWPDSTCHFRSEKSQSQPAARASVSTGISARPENAAAPSPRLPTPA